MLSVAPKPHTNKRKPEALHEVAQGPISELALPPACCPSSLALPPLILSPPLSWHRYALLRKSRERQGLDGLSNLNYLANVTYDALYKNITVNLTPELAQVSDY